MKTIIKAIIKIIALVFALQLLSPLVANIITVIRMYNDNIYTGNGQGILIYFLAEALFIILIAALVLYFGWWKTDKIVRLIAGDLKENALVVSTSNVNLYRVILSVLGICLLVTSVPSLLGLISYHIYGAQTYSDIFRPPPDVVASEIERWVLQIVTFLIGIWLTVGSKPIAKFFVRIWKQGW
jgi:hypothetical protein